MEEGGHISPRKRKIERMGRFFPLCCLVQRKGRSISIHHLVWYRDGRGWKEKLC